MKRILVILWCSLLLLNVLPLYAAEESDDSAKEIEVIPFKEVTKKGLVFRVPDDIPFVEKDGILKPITYEEYFYSKIRKLEKTVTDLKSRLEEVESAVPKVEKPVVETAQPVDENKSVVLP